MIEAPASVGRKENLRVPAEEEILLDDAGLAGEKRPFLITRLELEG